MAQLTLRLVPCEPAAERGSFGCDAMLSLLLACPNVMWTKKGRPMRRIAVIALLVLPVVSLVVSWLIWTRPPALVVSLRTMQEDQLARKND